MAKRVLNEWLIGPIKRHRRAVRENAKIRITERLEERHVRGLRGFANRRELISSFPKGGTVAEIGVAAGGFAVPIFEIARPSKLLLIDSWANGTGSRTPESDHETVKVAFAEQIAAGRVEVLQGISWDVVAELEDASLDWVYVDAGHDFDSVSRDLDAVRAKMKPGGIIAGHDFVRWGRFGGRLGVVEAVTRFCVRNDYGLIGLTVEADYAPSYAIVPLSGAPASVASQQLEAAG
jgi:predicted O-methyltransferase YrrM